LVDAVGEPKGVAITEVEFQDACDPVAAKLDHAYDQVVFIGDIRVRRSTSGRLAISLQI
jgi:hypothetical protein